MLVSGNRKEETRGGKHRWEGDNPRFDAGLCRCSARPSSVTPAELPLPSRNQLTDGDGGPETPGAGQSLTSERSKDPLCQAILSDHLIRSDIAASSRQPPPSLPAAILALPRRGACRIFTPILLERGEAPRNHQERPRHLCS